MRRLQIQRVGSSAVVLHEVLAYCFTGAEPLFASGHCRAGVIERLLPSRSYQTRHQGFLVPLALAASASEKLSWYTRSASSRSSFIPMAS